MSPLWLLPAFVFGVGLGLWFAHSKFSKWRKQFDADMLAKEREAAEKDEKALEDFEKKWNATLAEYRLKLDKMIMEEYLIKAEFPEEDKAN